MQWQLWDILQENAPEDIQPNPPSSGMLGKEIAEQILGLCFTWSELFVPGGKFPLTPTVNNQGNLKTGL